MNSPSLERLLHGNANAGGAGIAVAFDVAHDLLGRKFEVLSGGNNDAFIGLMRNKQRNVFEFHIGFLEGFKGGGFHDAHGKFENFASVHGKLFGEVGPVWKCWCDAFHMQMLAASTVRTEHETLEAVTFWDFFNDCGASTITEQYASGAVCPIQDF